MRHTKKSYRRGLCPIGMSSFAVSVKETDLWLAVDEKIQISGLPGKVEQFVRRERGFLERYIEKDPFFLQTHEPYEVAPGAPPIVHDMVCAGNKAGVGPMAAVAGALPNM